MDRTKEQEDEMLTIDNAVFALYPGMQMGILAVRNLDPSAPADPVMAAEAMEEIARRYGDLDRANLKATHPIRAYVEYYRKFGYSYHVLAQLESVLKGKKQLHVESGLLQSMFITEIESMLLTAGHDLAALKTPLRLAVAEGDEPYVSISGNEVTAVRDDLMVVSGGSIVSSILRGPDSASRITGRTTEALFTLYAPPGVETGYLYQTLESLERRIRACSPAAETLRLQVYSTD
jgi:DNA/RNA-binding domain of Phe-tRNA-synthetase-like protein